MYKLIKVYEYDEENGNSETNVPPPTNPWEFLDFILDKVNKIPEEYADSATIEMYGTTNYDSGYINIEIYYTRPETQEELDLIAASKAKAIARVIETDKIMLNRLIKEYGVPDDYS